MPTSFRPDRLDAIADAELTHPWFVARREMVIRLVARQRGPGPGRVVDVGCGTGRTLAGVSGPHDHAVGIDLLAGQAHAGPAAGAALIADVRALPLSEGRADVVLCLDVLEHVDRDDLVASELARVVRPGGIVVVTVPAHGWLWSFRDEDAGHVRRYSRSTLLQVLRDAGLQVDQLSWFAGTTLPVLALLRLVGRRWQRARDLEERPAAGLVGRVLGAALRAEARRVAAGRWTPVGSSLVALARRA